MIFNSSGRVTERITLLGRTESCVYLLDGGNEYAILGGGLSYIVPDVISQLEQSGIDEKLITRIVIHHTHFDHVGIVPFLKKRYPQAVVTASEIGAIQLSKPAVVNAIKNINSMMLSSMEADDRSGGYGLDFDSLQADDITKDGETRKVGDLSLEFIHVPGHSACSMAVYVPELKALFASDAGGIPFEDRVFAAANSNFDLYQASLRKMAAYDVEFHGAEHYGALTGEDAKKFMHKSIMAATETRALIEESLKKTKSVEITSKEITDYLAQSAGRYFLPRDVLKMVVGQMSGWLARNLGIIS